MRWLLPLLVLPPKLRRRGPARRQKAEAPADWQVAENGRYANHHTQLIGDFTLTRPVQEVGYVPCSTLPIQPRYARPRDDEEAFMGDFIGQLIFVLANRWSRSAIS